MKVLLLCFSLFALFLAPLSASQASALSYESTKMENHHDMADCGDEACAEHCESLGCEHDCAQCMSSCSHFATQVLSLTALPYTHLTNESRYHFSIQVMDAALFSPPPNAL